MTRLAQAAFALLVCATFGAFFVAQRLKNTPPAVQQVGVTPLFSPNRDGRKERVDVGFSLEGSDRVTVTVVDADGDAVRELVDSRELAGGERLNARWDGRADDGAMAPDGTYRVRVALRGEGRSVVLPRTIVKDTRPPDVRVTSIGPTTDTVPRPELLPRPDGEPVQVNFRAPGDTKRVSVYRTDVRPVRGVLNEDLPDDATSWEWDGTVEGRRVASGTYLVGIESRDAAGNIGTSVPELPPTLEFGEELPGRGGVTVRYLRAQAPSVPLPAAERAQVAVDSVGEPFSWRLRRVGEQVVRNRGRRSGTDVVTFRAPGGVSGLYLFEARTATRATATPVIVQSQQERPVLVVLPASTWQGTNPVDDDGDGRPNTLAAGLDVRVGRPYAGDGLPTQLPDQEAQLLRHLDREGHRYDLTTDVALARGAGPRLGGHRGVIVAGDARWLPPEVGRALRDYVREGGRLLSVGTRSLRRTVRLTPGNRLVDPSPPTRRDLFGARLAPLEREPVTLVSVLDEIDLFAGTEGQFGGVELFEPTTDAGPDATIVAAGATADGDRNVIVAARFGDGLVLRPGLPDFSLRLGEAPELTTLMERMWTLLSRR